MLNAQWLMRNGRDQEHEQDHDQDVGAVAIGYWIRCRCSGAVTNWAGAGVIRGSTQRTHRVTWERVRQRNGGRGMDALRLFAFAGSNVLSIVTHLIAHLALDIAHLSFRALTNAKCSMVNEKWAGSRARARSRSRRGRRGHRAPDSLPPFWGGHQLGRSWRDTGKHSKNSPRDMGAREAKEWRQGNGRPPTLCICRVERSLDRDRALDG